MNNKLRIAALALAALLVGAQLIPIDRGNPLVESDLEAPPELKSILHRACYDCHSNETVWPWYARIAPVSWLVAYDVREGREDLNFSSWRRLDAQARAKALREIWETVEEGEMPPFYYVPLHPEARLSASERETLRAWTSARP